MLFVKLTISLNKLLYFKSISQNSFPKIKMIFQSSSQKLPPKLLQLPKAIPQSYCQKLLTKIMF